MHNKYDDFKDKMISLTEWKSLQDCKIRQIYACALLILLYMHGGSIFYLTSCNSCTTDLMAEGMVFKIDDIICLKNHNYELYASLL